MEFSDTQKLWRNSATAFNGDDGFLDGSNLIQHTREDNEKFQSRQELAYYTNIFKPKVNRYVGYIFKKKPVRMSNTSSFNIIFDDVDNMGNNIDVFMSNFATKAKVRGVGLVLVDMSKELPSNLKEQLDSRVLPYLVEIDPTSVTKYRLDRYNKFEFIEYKDTLYINDELVNITRRYDKSGWSVKEEDKLIDSGEHSLGVCPVVYFSESGDFNSTGEFTQATQLLKRHYNLQSELDEILRYQTFPILTIQGDVEALETGVNNALVYDEASERPDFIAPPSSPAQLIQSRLKELEEYVATICYDLSTNAGVESGIALDIKFQGLNASLSKFASRLEDFERRFVDMMCIYLSTTNDIDINYAKDFSIIDVNKEIEIFSSMSELIESPTYFTHKAMQIINNDLTNIEMDTFDTILGELGEVKKEE